MSKIILAIAVIFMMMATGMLVSAAEDKASADTYVGTSANSEVVAKDISLSDKEVAKGNAIATTTSSGQEKRKTEAGKEYIIRAWGRSGPIGISQGYTGWRRIYFGGYAFLGSPIVTDSLNIGGNKGAIYSLGTDAGYTRTTSFDARITAHSGSVSSSYIDWVATRG